QSPRSDVDCLDLAWRRSTDRLVIALANKEIVLHEPTKRREREMMGNDRLLVLGADIEDEPVASKLKPEAIGSPLMTDGRERVFLHQIVDCDGALVFDVAVARPDAVLVEDDLDEAAAGFRRGHRRVVLFPAQPPR